MWYFIGDFWPLWYSFFSWWTLKLKILIRFAWNFFWVSSSLRRLLGWISSGNSFHLCKWFPLWQIHFYKCIKIGWEICLEEKERREERRTFATICSQKVGVPPLQRDTIVTVTIRRSIIYSRKKNSSVFGVFNNRLMLSVPQICASIS